MMKTIGAVVLAVLAIALLLPRSTGQAAPYSAPVGRYVVTNLSPGEFALMVDTTSGAVWRYGYADYCQSKTPPFSFRPIQDEQCGANELSVSHIPMFERVSVGGLYETPMQKMIDANFSRQALENYRKGVEKPKQ
jgi:hypothetical protein